MQINLKGSGDEAYAFTYEDEPTLELLIAPLTPLIDEACIDKATLQPPSVNGRFRRQIQMPKFRNGVYKREVFKACVKGWRFLDPAHPALVDQDGEPIPYSDEAKEKISEVHGGLVDFGFDIATALGQISADKVREERTAFRGTDQVPARVSDPQL